MLCRAMHAQRLVRPLVIVAIDEVVELGLLLQEVFPSRFSGLQLQRQMHALMAAVLLRAAWFDALDLDAEPEPPDGELGEVEEGIRTGEGNAVIGADGLGQSELLENGLEHGKSIGFPCGGERLAGEGVAAGEVSDCQRIAIAPVGDLPSSSITTPCQRYASSPSAPAILTCAGQWDCVKMTRTLRTLIASFVAYRERGERMPYHAPPTKLWGKRSHLYQSFSPRRLLFFVHGFGGENTATWHNFPSLLLDDAVRFPEAY